MTIDNHFKIKSLADDKTSIEKPELLTAVKSVLSGRIYIGDTSSLGNKTMV